MSSEINLHRNLRADVPPGVRQGLLNKLTSPMLGPRALPTMKARARNAGIRLLKNSPQMTNKKAIATSSILLPPPHRPQYPEGVCSGA